MRKGTKTISLLLTVAVMLTMVFPVTASAAFSDVPASHQYYEAITNLSSEGILNGMEDGTFAPENSVTRAQFTKILCYALSLGDITHSDEEKSVFTDVAPDHWAANNIITAYKQGIINGMGDGTFAPEAGVNYEQAVKMVVCALGRGAEAVALGGYPGGYMSVASKEKLLKGITDAKMGEPMKRGSVAQLVDSMLDADQVVDGEEMGSIRDEVKEGKKAEGQVVAGYGVSIYSTSYNNKCARKQMAVKTANGDVIFDISELNLDIYDILGRSVIVYYEDEIGSVETATNIAMQPKKNEEVKIDFNMIADYDNSTIEYYVDNSMTNTKEVRYLSNSNNLYNGQPIVDDLYTLIGNNINKPGNVTLVSSQANGSADVAFVKSYETIIVQKTDKIKEKVFGKNCYLSGSGLDLSDDTKEVVITNNGKAVEFENIKENQILSVARDAGNKRVEVLVAPGSTKSGVISEMPETTKIVIDGKTYNVLFDATNNLPYKEATEAALDTGKNVTVYLDAFGNVVRYLTKAEAALSYGYLSELDDNDDDKPVQIMVYKATNTNSSLNTGTIYDLASKVKINNHTYDAIEDKDEIKDVLDDTAEQGTYSQPIRFAVSTNNSKVINNIVTSAQTGQIAVSLNIDDKTASGLSCTVTGQKFADGYSIKSSTPIILVKNSLVSGTGITTSDKYQTKSSGYFKKGTTYYIKIANKSTLNEAACVYVYAATNPASVYDEGVAPYIVVNKGERENPNDGLLGDYFLLENIATGEQVTAFKGNAIINDTMTSFNINDLEIGDVIRVVVDDLGYIENADYAADRSRIAVDIPATGTATPDFAYVINSTPKYTLTQGEGTGTSATYFTRVGVVNTVNGMSFILREGFGSTGSTETFNLSSTTPIYEVDLSAANNKVDKGETVSYTNLIDATHATTSDPVSRVLVYAKNGSVKAVVIFKYKNLSTPAPAPTE